MIKYFYVFDLKNRTEEKFGEHDLTSGFERKTNQEIRLGLQARFV